MPTATKRDYILISIVGAAIGLLVLPVLANLRFAVFAKLSITESVAIILGFTVFSAVALWLSSLVSRLLPVFLQVAEYAAIGVLNTLIDLGVLNALILFSGFAAGFWYILFKSASFITANINSYFWNKYWTFGSKRSIEAKEVGQFFAVSLIGFGINVSMASAIVNFIAPFGSVSPARWANVGAVVASVLALAWNYIGYKFVVFRTGS